MNLKKNARLIFYASFMLFLCATSLADNIWDLEEVDAEGRGTHPKNGAPISPDNKVTIQGIALNNPAELLPTTEQWQVYVQAEPPDRGGIAAWAGIFYADTPWPRYPLDIQPGDRIRLEGFIMDNAGKVNINERHSLAAAFTVTKLQSGVGMPAPQEITNLSTCNFFDQMRASGGEKYQAQWVKLKGVHISSGAWGNDKSLTIADDAGSTLTMYLSSEGDFNDHSAPAGGFNVTGIFDQEDTYLPPWHDSYRLWVKKYSDIEFLTRVVRSLWCQFE